MLSIIIPVYNREKEIMDCLKSLTSNKSLNDLLDVIVIDDGSTDNTLKVIKRLCKKNKNFRYFTQANKGVSSARNLGVSKVRYATSKDLITFLDSDDELSNNFFDKVSSFFAQHQDVNIATIPLIYRHKKNVRNHILNYRYEKEKVIKILDNPEDIHYHIGGVFFRGNLKGHLKFSEKLHFWEDAFLVNKLILKEGKYGVIPEAAYYYRKEHNKGSLSMNAWKQSYRFIDTIEFGYLGLIDFSNKIYGHVIPYVQYLIVDHYSIFLFQRNQKFFYSTLTSSEQEYFFKLSNILFRHISISSIERLKYKKYIKEYLLSAKKEGFPLKTMKLDSDNFYKSNLQLVLRRAKISLKGFILYGEVNNDFSEVDKNFKVISDKNILIEKANRQRKIKIFGVVVRGTVDNSIKLIIPFWKLKVNLHVTDGHLVIPLGEINIYKIVLKRIKKIVTRMRKVLPLAT